MQKDQTTTPIANAGFCARVRRRNANAMQTKHARSSHYSFRLDFLFSLSLSLASIAHATRAQAPIVLETGTFSAGTTHHRRHQARQRARPRNPAAQALASAPLPRAQRPGHRRFAWLGVSNDDDDAHGGDSRQASPAEPQTNSTRLRYVSSCAPLPLRARRSVWWGGGALCARCPSRRSLRLRNRGLAVGLAVAVAGRRLI